MKTLSFAFLGFATSFLVCADTQGATSAPDLTGRWEVTTSYPGGSFVAGLDLAVEAGKYSGKSGYLVPDGYWYKYSGALQHDGLHLRILGPDGKTEIGSLVLGLHGVELTGKGVIHDVPLSLLGKDGQDQDCIDVDAIHQPPRPALVLDRNSWHRAAIDCIGRDCGMLSFSPCCRRLSRKPVSIRATVENGGVLT